MKVKITQLDLPPGFTPEQLLKAVAKRVRCPVEKLGQVREVRRSIDARGRRPRLTVAVEAHIPGQLPRGVMGVE